MPTIRSIEHAYEILEISHGSDHEEVKRAYKKLALKTHPDKNRDDPEAHKKFLLISEAYKRITDPDSFKEEEEEASEEEMEAMFNMMFAEMMGVQGFEFGDNPFEMFAFLEQMMDEEGAYDSDEDSDDEDMQEELFRRYAAAQGMEEHELYGDEEDYGDELQDHIESFLLAELMAAGMGGMGMGHPGHGHGAGGRAKGRLGAGAPSGTKKKAGKIKSKKKEPVPTKSYCLEEEDVWESASEDEPDTQPPPAAKAHAQAQEAPKKAESKSAAPEAKAASKPSRIVHEHKPDSKQQAKASKGPFAMGDDPDIEAAMRKLVGNFSGGKMGSVLEQQMLNLMMSVPPKFDYDYDDYEDEDDYFDYFCGDESDEDEGRSAASAKKKKKSQLRKKKAKAKKAAAAKEGQKAEGEAATTAVPVAAAPVPAPVPAPAPVQAPVPVPASVPARVPAPAAPAAPASSGKSPSSATKTGSRSVLGTAASTEEVPEERKARSMKSAAYSGPGIPDIGDKVTVNKRHTGVVAYVGTVHYAKGVYVGVVMDDDTVGKNNGKLSQSTSFAFHQCIPHHLLAGSVKGITYFKCPTNKKALLVAVGEVEKI